MKNFFWICVILSLFGCKKKENSIASIPVLITSPVINVGGSSATCGGNITSDGGSTITSRGVCWGLNNDPSTEDSYTSNGYGPGSFSSEIKDLIQHTNYYVRAYAKNSAGTGYGNSVMFTTTSAFIDGTYHLSIEEFTYHSTILNGESIKYTVNQNDSVIFNCNYECKGKLISDPQNGFIVDGVWYKFFRISGMYQSIYFVVQQKDEQNIIIKTSIIDYESAYKLGYAYVYNK